jgi:hypothetical protein
MRRFPLAIPVGDRSASSPSLVNFVEDVILFGSLMLARVIVWRELRRRRTQAPTERDAKCEI